MLLTTLLLVQTPLSRERFARLATDYGIEIRVQSTVVRASRGDFYVTAQPVSDTVLAQYAPLFDDAWRRYPVSLMRRVGLRRIVVGADVRVEGQPRAIVPEFAPGWLWVDAAVGARVPEYGRRALHHDFFHMMDRAIDPGADGRDRAWAGLNAPGFHYGIGGWWMQTKGVGDLRTDLPGFLTAYSTSAVEEDKAEVFSHLLCDPAFVAARATADPVVMSKVARLKALVAAFEPAMDTAWWPKAPLPAVAP